MSNNTLPDTPLPGQNFSGSTSPRQLSRHGSASTPSHNNRYVYQPANPMRRSPERDAMLAATASRAGTPSRQIREAFQNLSLGSQTSENQSLEPGAQGQLGSRRRPLPLTSLLDTRPHLNVPPTPLSPHATPFQVPNPYHGSNLSQNVAQQATQHVLNLQRAGQTSQTPQATNTHENPYDQAYQSGHDIYPSSTHNLNTFAGPQQQQQVQPRQQATEYYPPAPAYVPPGYEGPHHSTTQNFNRLDPRYVPATPTHWHSSQDGSTYEGNTSNHYQPRTPLYQPQAPQYQPQQQFQPQNTPSGASTPHAETLNNLRSNARTSSTNLPLLLHDPTARKAEARIILKDLEHDKRKLIKSRNSTFQEIQILEGSLDSLKSRRNAMIAQRDYGEMSRNRSESVFSSLGNVVEALRTPTMPAAMRATMGSQQSTPGHGAYQINMDQQSSAASTPQANTPRSISIGQQIYSMEKDLADVMYIHGEYGRMFKNVEDNMERMWEAVYCPEGGWPEDDY